jgi:hypothetical protein
MLTWIVVAIIIMILVFIGIVYSISLAFTTKQNISMETKTKALDVFVYLGIFITLVVTVTNFLEITFTAIERKFADVLDTTYSIDIYNDSVRMAMASLVVVFPLYVLLSWYTSRDIGKFLYKRDILVRKAMVYASIFVTIVTLVGTLVSLIYTYLGGELSVRFELKALTIFSVALAVFGYYLYSLRRDYSKKTNAPLVIAMAVSLVVIASLIWSISIIGTPASMRAKRIDSTRLSDISRIQQEVFNHVQSTDTLPTALTELDNAFQGYSVPVDPVTKSMYTYKVLQQPTMKMDYATNKKQMATPAIFELCATFDTTRNMDARGKATGNATIASPIGTEGVDASYSINNYYSDNDVSPFWNHAAGVETCFKRIISPSMYYGR